MESNFILGYLPFWVVTYFLALTAWGCLGRFMMQFFMTPTNSNYIWRGFQLLTNWAVWTAERLVPSYVSPPFLPLVAAFWLFAVRMIFGLIMVGLGYAPRISPPGAG